MKKWIRHYANISPKQGVVIVMEQTFYSNNPRYRKKRLKVREVKRVPIAEQIPMEAYESITEHFDSTAFQSDDRFFTTTTIQMRPNQEICKRLAQQALMGFNTEPMEAAGEQREQSAENK